MTRDGDSSSDSAVDINDRYHTIRESAAEMASEADKNEYWFDADAVREVLRDAAGDVDGELFAFVGNDFGLSLAFRPEGTARDRQEAVADALLARGEEEDGVLSAVADRIRATDDRIHKVLVAAIDVDGNVRYHCPLDGTPPGFLTLCEAVGIVNVTTQGFRQSIVSQTY